MDFRRCPKDKPLNGLAYLSGLLHNIGFVLLRHTFPMEFDELNNALTKAEPGNVSSIERMLLGVHHYELSIWLMRKWGLPKEMMTAVFEHHNEDYKGINWQYANLALLVDRILFNYDLGDAESGELPQRILNVFELDSSTPTTLYRWVQSQPNVPIQGIARRKWLWAITR